MAGRHRIDTQLSSCLRKLTPIADARHASWGWPSPVPEELALALAPCPEEHKQWCEKSIGWMTRTSGARNTQRQLLSPPFWDKKFQSVYNFRGDNVAFQKKENPCAWMQVALAQLFSLTTTYRKSEGSGQGPAPPAAPTGQPYSLCFFLWCFFFFLLWDALAFSVSFAFFLAGWAASESLSSESEGGLLLCFFFFFFSWEGGGWSENTVH